MIIDMHNHVWPDKVAPRALGAGVPDMDLFGDGTVAGLEAAARAAGIDRSVCLAVANTAAQVEPANRYIGTIDRSRFIPFGTIHPDLTVEENVAHLESAGVAGVKVHPTFQRFALDDPRLLRILQALAGWLPVIMHVGSGGGGDGSQATPGMVRDIVTAVPDLTLIACHFGGYHHFDEAIDALVGLAVYFDTSWPPSLSTLPSERVRDVIERHGADRVVFASDWPTASPAAEVQAIRDLGLSDTDTALVLGGNAARLLNL